MKAADVMTISVITAAVGTSIREVTQLMLQHRISGIPVLDRTGAVVGIITEGDLLRRTEIGTALRYQRSWWPLIGVGRLAQDYVNANALTVGEIMTKTVASVTSTAELTDAVRLMQTLRVKRLPIIDDGQLVGILSRADLLRPLAANSAAGPTQNIDDTQIRNRILAEISTQEWASQMAVDAVVKDGVVELSGTVADERQKAALMVLVGKLPGIRTVLDRVTPKGQTEESLKREETRAEHIERLIKADEPDDR